MIRSLLLVLAMLAAGCIAEPDVKQVPQRDDTPSDLPDPAPEGTGGSNPGALAPSGEGVGTEPAASEPAPPPAPAKDKDKKPKGKDD